MVYLTPISMHIHMKNNIQKYNINVYTEHAIFTLLRGRDLRFTKLVNTC